MDDLRPLCSRCHSLLHVLVREGQAGLDPTLLFVAGRSEVYAQSRPDLLAEQPKRLSDMSEAERREYNRALKRGEITPRDWRDERALPTH